MKRRFKRLLMVTFVLMVAIGLATQAGAITLNEFEDGCLVPAARYGSDYDIAVGLIVWNYAIGYSIYWNYLSANGAQLAHGSIPIQDQTYNYSFSLKTADGNSHPETLGYLIFTFDDDGTLETSEDRQYIYANAVILSNQDAAFLPCIPLDRGCGDYANVDLNLANLNSASIVGLCNGFGSAQNIDCRYWIDSTVGARTYLLIWTTQNPPANLTGEIYTVSGGPSAAISMTPANTRVNLIDVATEVAGIPSGYVDGSIYLDSGGGDRIILSLIESTAFSATQTLLGGVRN